MFRYLILAAAIVAAAGTAAAAEKVTIFTEPIDGQQITACDLTGFDFPTLDAMEATRVELCPDAPVYTFFNPGETVRGACDDSGDCNRTITDVCNWRGSTVSEMEFNAGKKKCQGKCADGTYVYTVCPRLNPSKG